MAIYWLTSVDPDEKGYFVVDWTDEMDAAGDTINGTPTFTFIDASVYGLQVTDIAIVTGSKKVEAYISNSDAATNRTNVLANSPYLITHKITTAGGQTLQRVLGLVVAERGSQLTLEDGSVVTGANCYVGLEAADAYHEQRGNTDWTGTDTERCRDLVRGAEWLDNYWIGRWKGTKTNSDQAMQWPRADATDEDGNDIGSGTIPQRIKDANAMAALVVPMTHRITYAAQVKRVKGGSAEVEFTDAGLVSRERIDLIYELVRPYLRPAGRLLRGAG